MLMADTKLLPPNSFINAEEFESAEQLAEFLIFLSENKTEYNKYHLWRQYYSVVQEHGYYGTQASHYCRLCQALNFNSRQHKVYPSLSSWFGKSHCRRPAQKYF